MPGVISAVTQARDLTATSFNQVVRSVGFSLGRAIGPSLSTSGETLTIEESMTLRARTENAGHGDEHEWSWGGG